MPSLLSLLTTKRVPPPDTAPPNYIPEKSQAQSFNTAAPSSAGGPTVFAVDPGAIFPCINQFVYLWTSNGRGFWAYVTYVGPRSLAGFRFRRRRWQYFGMDLRQIDSFYCA